MKIFITTSSLLSIIKRFKSMFNHTYSGCVGLFLLVWVSQAVAQFAPLRHIAHPVESALLGNKVQLNGDWAFIAAPYETIGQAESAGAVYVYRFAENSWQFAQRIISDTTFFHLQLGREMAASEHFLALSVQSVYDETHQGSVYIYNRVNDTYEFLQELNLAEGHPNDIFGSSLAMNDSYLIIGINGKMIEDTPIGSIAIFENKGNSWEFMQHIQPPTMQAFQEFGRTVAISEQDEIFVGAPKVSATDSLSGAVYVYGADMGSFALKQTLSPSNTHFRSKFGSSISVDKNLLVIGAPGSITARDSLLAQPTGLAYVFEKTENSWTQTAQLSPEMLQPNMKFGAEVRVNDGILAVAARRFNHGLVFGAGAVYLYVYENGVITNSFLLMQDSPQEWSLFGSGLALDNRHLLVGAQGADLSTQDAGMAFFYETEALLNVGLDETISAQNLPKQIELKGNYPNPFNPETTIKFALPKPEHVTIQIYDVLGRLLATVTNQVFTAGVHDIRVDSRAWASGVYVYRFQAGNKTFQRKMTLIK
jgi:hypothetical protein